FKDMGLVSQVFDETSLGSLRGHIAVGHARYSTTGASVWENAQPTFRATAHGSIALGHNGNLVNTVEQGHNDEDDKPLTVEKAAPHVLPKVKGAFSCVFMDEKEPFTFGST
ncbi:class II glutamine amidotransferase, partial [Streptomyces daliensis]|nr:class II glutamine amidotransferase [Streptomyces daliensis]